MMHSLTYPRDDKLKCFEEPKRRIFGEWWPMGKWRMHALRVFKFKFKTKSMLSKGSTFAGLRGLQFGILCPLIYRVIH